MACVPMLAFAASGTREDVARACALELPQALRQGALVLGRAKRECTIEYRARTLSRAPDGSFVFGIDRDAPAQDQLILRDVRGSAQTFLFPVTPRRYRIERVDGVPESTVNPSPEIAARIAREQAAVAKARERDDAREDYRFGFQWPLRGRVSGYYGSQRILNGTPKNPHMGLDIAAPSGTPIRAPAAGIVSFAEPDLYLTGGTVVLDHGHGLSSVFVHLSRLDVQPGQRLEQGDVLGAVGMTGRASGPHLHWGMNWFDVRVDPGPLVGAPD
jgi:murein DD-endopeptidase MepM/ murein hydrolase activator NlpD